MGFTYCETNILVENETQSKTAVGYISTTLHYMCVKLLLWI